MTTRSLPMWLDSNKGLKEFAACGHLIIDGTYTPVNNLDGDEADAGLAIKPIGPLVDKVDDAHRLRLRRRFGDRIGTDSF